MSGGCFVVLSAEGLFWDGGGWVRDGARARGFSEGPDAYADCALAASCLRRLGHLCNVAYLPKVDRRPVLGPGVAVASKGEKLDVPHGSAL